MKKDTWIYIVIAIFIILVIAGIYYSKSDRGGVDEELARCIGENSLLYVRLGCHYCDIQEEMFGKSVAELNIIDCFYDQEECAKENLIGTPTWKINGELYPGVKEIEELKALTGC